MCIEFLREFTKHAQSIGNSMPSAWIFFWRIPNTVKNSSIVFVVAFASQNNSVRNCISVEKADSPMNNPVGARRDWMRIQTFIDSSDGLEVTYHIFMRTIGRDWNARTWMTSLPVWRLNPSRNLQRELKVTRIEGNANWRQRELKATRIEGNAN